MKVKYVGLALLLALSAGCTPIAPATEAAPETRPVSADAIRFAADFSYDTILSEAAGMFAEKVIEISEGRMWVEVVPVTRAAQSLAAGEAQLAFLDGRADTDIMPIGELFSTPLRYQSYDHFARMLNSNQVLAALNEDLTADPGVRLLGAYYQGTDFLVSTVPFTRDNLFRMVEDDDDEEVWLPSPVAVLRKGSGMSEVLYAFGMEVLEDDSMEERFRVLFDGTALLSEFTAEELGSMDWTESGVYLIQSNHSIVPRWLAVDEAFYQTLTPNQQAVLQEACAYLVPAIDEMYQARENQALGRLRSEGVAADSGFDRLRGDLALIAQEEAGLSGLGSRYLIQLLQSYA